MDCFRLQIGAVMEKVKSENVTYLLSYAPEPLARRVLTFLPLTCFLFQLSAFHTFPSG
jgi:hypothetical protein